MFTSVNIDSTKWTIEVKDPGWVNNELQAYTDKKDNLINTYFDKYKSFEFDHTVTNNDIVIFYSKFGIIEIKNKSIDKGLKKTILKQSIPPDVSLQAGKPIGSMADLKYGHESQNKRAYGLQFGC